ncbi:MAG: hypothetical protein GXP62_03605 [Oligoflexia bacterium]|nr:hypothetical protein [Oligoflexia bacterium]
MWRSALALLLAGALLGGPAWAGDSDPDEVSEETVGGKRVGGLDTQQIPLVEQYGLSNDLQGSAYSERVKRGAQVLHASLPFVKDCVDGIEYLYHRRYKQARDQFAMIGHKYPGSAAEPVGQVLVWQALMLENFDFKYVDQYELASKRARMQLEEALYQPGNDAWEYFLLAGMLGIDSIHTMRTGEYLKALSRGVEAMKAVAHAKEYAPDFVDATLGDGLFNYWRTVIAKSTRAIPDMGDRRAQGIAQLQLVESKGIFLAPAATLSLVYTWMEEGDMKKALAETQKNRRDYPDSVINNLVLGRTYMYMKRFGDSERTFKQVIAMDPNNERVYYYLTRLFMRTRNLAQAHQSIDHYLTFQLDDETRGYALYQQGLIAYRLKDWDAAASSFKECYRLTKLERAKRRLESIKQKRAGG